MPQVSFNLSSLWVQALLLGAGVVLAGCRKEEIASYSVPKEVPSQPSTNGQPATMGPSRPIAWTTPSGWREQAASGMRAGSFQVRKGDQQADVSIIPLNGASGSELDNVNRWRRQIALEPLDAGKLQSMAEAVTIGSTPAPLYEMVGTNPETKQPARILGAMLSAGGTTWFFKMTGSDSLVAEEKPAFKSLLKSVQFNGGAGDPSAGPSESRLSPAGGGATAPVQVQGSAVNADKPTWDVPAGWQEQAPTSMRLASFLVKGEKGATADISVFKLGGEAGGLLPNVNRWRQQVGLGPVDDAGLQKLLSVHDIGGTKITLVDMAGQSVESGQKARLVAAVVPRIGVTWFFKMLGDESLVAREKPAFVKFVESVRYPNAF